MKVHKGLEDDRLTAVKEDFKKMELPMEIGRDLNYWKYWKELNQCHGV